MTATRARAERSGEGKARRGARRGQASSVLSALALLSELSREREASPEFRGIRSYPYSLPPRRAPCLSPSNPRATALRSFSPATPPPPGAQGSPPLSKASPPPTRLSAARSRSSTRALGSSRIQARASPPTSLDLRGPHAGLKIRLVTLTTLFYARHCPPSPSPSPARRQRTPGHAS